MHMMETLKRQTVNTLITLVYIIIDTCDILV